MTRVEQIQAECNEKMARETERAEKEGYEARIAQFVQFIGAKGGEKLTLVAALRHVAFELEQEAEKEGFYKL